MMKYKARLSKIKISELISEMGAAPGIKVDTIARTLEVHQMKKLQRG